VALAEVLHDRTRGNPLLVRELLGVAGREAALWFDTTERRWFWDLDRIRRIGMGEDGVELLLPRLRGLPADTQRLLHLAACLGATFDLATLALIEGNPLPVVAQGLSEAVGGSWCF
jgi:predicted ATPase